MKKLFLNLSLCAFTIATFMSVSEIDNKVEDVDVRGEVVTVITYEQNGHQYSVIVHEIVDCGSVTSGSTGGVVDCFHTVI